MLERREQCNPIPVKVAESKCIVRSGDDNSDRLMMPLTARMQAGRRDIRGQNCSLDGRESISQEKRQILLKRQIISQLRIQFY